MGLKLIRTFTFRTIYKVKVFIMTLNNSKLNLKWMTYY